MGKENILRTIFNRVYEYFTVTAVRKVFFFSACGALLLFALNFAMSYGSLGNAAIVFTAVCICASIFDTWQQRKDFIAEIDDMEYAHFVRIVSEKGESAITEYKGLLAENEIKYVRRKKREYAGSIALKIMILIFLVVLLT